jgi:hypothetical protein
MEKDDKLIDNKIIILKIIHFALLSGQIIFSGVVFFLHANNMFPVEFDELSNILLIVVPVFSIAAIAGSTVITKIRLKQVSEMNFLKEKLNHYIATLIVKYAIIEAVSVFASVCYLLTAHTVFLLYIFLLILYFIINRPTRQKALTDLGTENLS